MNKLELSKRLAAYINIPLEKSQEAINIIEENNIFSSKEQDNIIKKLKEKLNIDEIKAEEIYNCTKSLIHQEIVDKIKHPFKSSSN